MSNSQGSERRKGRYLGSILCNVPFFFFFFFKQPIKWKLNWLRKTTAIQSTWLAGKQVIKTGLWVIELHCLSKGNRWFVGHSRMDYWSFDVGCVPCVYMHVYKDVQQFPQLYKHAFVKTLFFLHCDSGLVFAAFYYFYFILFFFCIQCYTAISFGGNERLLRAVCPEGDFSRAALGGSSFFFFINLWMKSRRPGQNLH